MLRSPHLAGCHGGESGAKKGSGLLSKLLEGQEQNNPATEPLLQLSMNGFCCAWKVSCATAQDVPLAPEIFTQTWVHGVGKRNVTLW